MGYRIIYSFDTEDRMGYRIIYSFDTKTEWDTELFTVLIQKTNQRIQIYFFNHGILSYICILNIIRTFYSVDLINAKNM